MGTEAAPQVPEGRRCTRRSARRGPRVQSLSHGRPWYSCGPHAASVAHMHAPFPEKDTWHHMDAEPGDPQCATSVPHSRESRRCDGLWPPVASFGHIRPATKDSVHVIVMTGLKTVVVEATRPHARVSKVS